MSKDNSCELKSGLMVVSKKLSNGTEVLISYKTELDRFVSSGIGYEEGRVIKCYWSADGKYIAIPTVLIVGVNEADNGGDCSEFDINYDLSSNIINIDKMRNDIDQKRIQYGNWITNSVIMDVVRAHIGGLEGKVETCEDLIDDLFIYWATYIKESPSEKSSVVNNSEIFRDRAAKLLGL